MKKHLNKALKFKNKNKKRENGMTVKLLIN